MSNAVPGSPLPISAIGAHVVVHQHGSGLRGFRAGYETHPEQTLIFSDLRVTGQVVDEWGLAWYRCGPVRIQVVAEQIAIGASAGAELVWRDDSGVQQRRLAAGDWLWFTPYGPPRLGEPAPAEDSDWQRWMASVPDGGEWHELVRRAWYVLGLNTVRLGAAPEWLAVVPSLFGYVGAWLWDSYFIARGLRHGLPGVAREQLRLVLGAQGEDGQLPDVIHDFGVLANSLDLAPVDLVNLTATASPYLNLTEPVPLTKPPLAAWTLAALHRTAPDPDFLAWALPRVAASQDWWLARAVQQGYAGYQHPYSSGMDDNPIYDHSARVETPELAGFLLEEDGLLAELGHPANHSAGWLADRLAATFDAAAGCFRPFAHQPAKPAEAIMTDTVAGLLPLHWAGLPQQVAGSLAATIFDPERYGTAPGVPSVARTDPAHQPGRMWRGPAWLNVNALLAEGLDRHGFSEHANRLRVDSLRMVERSGGFPEYIDLRTGGPGDRAVACFGWTAAVVVDFAVTLAAQS